MPRIIVFGATGLTGRLAAEALVAAGRRPVLAGRSHQKLARVADELGGDLEVAVADASDPRSVTGIVQEGDVIVATAGPFVRWGDAALEAALGAGAHYLDSNGEPPFTRRVFEKHATAVRSRSLLLPAFGFESVLGNLAGALALREAGDGGVRVDTGYFYTDPIRLSRLSRGSRASLTGAMVLPSFAFRDGVLRTVQGGERYRAFALDGTKRGGVSLGASEHFTLPRTFPQLREVNAYLGWFGRLSWPLHALSRVGFAALRLPGARSVYDAAASRYIARSRGEPRADERAPNGVHVVGLAYDAHRRELAAVHLRGVEGYEFTGRILAWGARRVAEGGVAGVGALGPIEAFGIEATEAGCREAGVSRVDPDV